MASKLRLGVAGPVGSGKTALVEALCHQLSERLELAVVTNDIYTQEDAQFLTRAGVLEPERIRGVETGGCPHTPRSERTVRSIGQRWVIWRHSFLALIWFSSKVEETISQPVLALS